MLQFLSYNSWHFCYHSYDLDCCATFIQYHSNCIFNFFMAIWFRSCTMINPYFAKCNSMYASLISLKRFWIIRPWLYEWFSCMFMYFFVKMVFTLRYPNSYCKHLTLAGSCTANVPFLSQRSEDQRSSWCWCEKTGRCHGKSSQVRSSVVTFFFSRWLLANTVHCYLDNLICS